MDTLQKTKHIYLQLLDFTGDNKTCVLATVTESHGSTPQKPGSSAIYGLKRLLAGTVGGGAVELAIGEIAAEAVASKKSGYFRFDLDNDISDTEAAICGGGMSILVDATPEKHVKIFEALKEKTNWKPAKSPSGRGFGIACGFDAGTYVAHKAKVQVDKKTGHVQVLRVVCA